MKMPKVIFIDTEIYTYIKYIDMEFIGIDKLFRWEKTIRIKFIYLETT